MRRLPFISPVRALPGLAVAASLALASLPAHLPAQAQPMRLTPPPGAEPAQESPPAQSPQSETPVQPSPAAQAEMPAQAAMPPATPPAAPSGNPDAGIRIEALRAPDPSSAGLLTEESGGLGPRMWGSTSRDQAERVVSLLPTPVNSPGLRQLQRRLLLSIAEAPGNDQAPPSLLGLRLEQLYRLGAVSEAAQLGTPRPASLRDPIFATLPIDQALLRNDLDTACNLGGQALRQDAASPDWLRLAVLCRYRGGDVSGGDLALSLWRDQGGEDTAFQALAAALRGDDRAKVDSLGARATPLAVAMLRTAKRPLPASVIQGGHLDSLPPALLPALADLPELEPEARLALLERGVALGAVAPSRLIAAYSQLEITEAQRADIAAGKLKGSRAAAAFFQQARELTLGPARAEALKHAYDLAVARGTLFVTATLLRESLRDLPATPESLEAAPAVIRLALAAGEGGTARLWRNTLLSHNDPAAQAAVARAWPLLLLAEPPANAWPEAQYQAWSAALGDLPAPRKAALQALVLVLAEAAGIGVPAETWQALAQPGLEGASSAPPVAYWRNLLRAAESGSRAETVALTLVLLGGDGMAKADPASLATAFGALKHVKLEAEVRALALEAALARGL